MFHAPATSYGLANWAAAAVGASVPIQISNVAQYMHFILTPRTSMFPNDNPRIRLDLGLITIMAAEIAQYVILLSSTQYFYSRTDSWSYFEAYSNLVSSMIEVDREKTTGQFKMIKVGNGVTIKDVLASIELFNTGESRIRRVDT